MSDQKIIQAFHAIWGNFLEAVMITQKSREIVTVNKAVDLGYAFEYEKIAR